FQFFQERNKGADDHDLVAMANIGRVEGVDAVTQLDIRMRPTLPTTIGESIDGRNPDRAPDPMTGKRLACQIDRPTAAQFPRKWHRHRRTGATYRLRDRFDRRSTSAGSPAVELDAGEKQSDHCSLDRDLVE